MDKYRLSEDSKSSHDYSTLYRIIALRDFGDVREGHIGGYVEREENLSHDGLCWVYDNSMVYEGARINHNASVRGDCYIHGAAKIKNSARVAGHVFITGSCVVSGQSNVISDKLQFSSGDIQDALVTIKPISLEGLFFPVTITDQHMRIGSDQRKFSEWFALKYGSTEFTNYDTKNFWEKHRKILKDICEKYRGYNFEFQF